jgi:uncharacterized RDD family membrane protein YckC
MTLFSTSRPRRFAHMLIDGVVFFIVWNIVLEVTKVRFPFGVMQRFSQQDYDAYVKIMSWMTLTLFALSIVMHALFGGSIGKLIMRHRTVHEDGAPMSQAQAAKRSAVLFGLGIAILAPGPLVAFFLGKGSEALSLASLALGLLVWVGSTGPWLLTRASPLEAYLKLATVRADDLTSPARRKAVQPGRATAKRRRD